MRFSPQLLEQINSRTDLVALIGRRVKLTRKGRVMWGCCPFHNEKSGSFKVENERGAYKCFGCGAGGDAFKWLMETEGLTFPEAVERLAADAGVDLPRMDPADQARAERSKTLYQLVDHAAAFFEAQLRAPAGAAARDYLRGRGLDGEAAKRFRLGYAPAGRTQLLEHLKTLNVTTDAAIEAGLVKPADDAGGVRDFFFDRLIFPIGDARGRLVAFGARALAVDVKPKYLNTAETPLFAKGQLLYNFAAARPAAIKAQTIILAEGYMDVIGLQRGGFDHAVAPLGTALTVDQLQLLWRCAAEPILAFDGDDAGLRAAHRAAHLALPLLRPGHSLRFAFLPGGEDPDSLIRKRGAATMRDQLDGALPLSQVLWRAETAGKQFSTPERRAGLEAALSDLVGKIKDEGVRGYYRRDFAGRIHDSFKVHMPPPTQPAPRRGSGRDSALASSAIVRGGADRARQLKEAELARLVIADPQLAVLHAEALAHATFTHTAVQALVGAVLNLVAENPDLDAAGLLAAVDAGLVAKLGRSFVPDAEREAVFLQLAARLR